MALPATPHIARSFDHHRPVRPALPALTGARFFAALAVLWVHYQYAAASSIPVWVGRVNVANAGVSFFFVLSGFILTYTYADAFRHGVTRGPLIDYARARFARIYPLYVCALVVSTFAFIAAPLAEYSIRELAISWFAQLFAIHPWFPVRWLQDTWNAPGWSIGTEIFFYAVFPFAIAAILRQRRVFALGACIFAFQLAAYLLIVRTFDDAGMIVHRFPPFRTCDFLLGCCAGALYLRGTRERYVPLSLLAIAFACMEAWYVLHPDPTRFRVVLQGPLFAAAVYGIACGRYRFLEWRPVVLLGEASYALYLMHWAPLLLLFEHYGRGNAPLGVTIGVAMGCVLLSIACYRAVETPARQWLRSAKLGTSPRKLA